MARTNKVSNSKKGAFKHKTSIGKNGEILYDAPIQIKDQNDLKHYGITNEDCRYLHFGASEKMRVYFFKTTNREFADAQWEYLNTQHSAEYYNTRCMVPGKRKAFIRCRDTNKCSECPYGIKPEDKQAAVVSWDELLESGWEPVPVQPVERRVMAKVEYEAIRDRMDAEDPRIAQAFEAKELFGDSIAKIAVDLGISEPRVYQMISRAKEIGKEYREENSNE